MARAAAVLLAAMGGVAAASCGQNSGAPCGPGVSCVPSSAQDASGVDDAHDAFDANTIVGNGSVQKMPLGGGAITSLATNLIDPTSIAVDATNVYFAQIAEGAIESVPIAGGAVTGISSGQSNAGGVLVDCGNLYWATYNSIVKMPVAGGPTTTIASGFTYPGSLAVDESYIYWTVELAGTLMKAPK